ncbi:hypothetical protein GCM10022243_36730 [Saccharothrix violaceirubra]|uniref:DUF7224 domain-containing protein n=1 Tax=Saccharothrix violaceirubra TaxID=413306 RepID=A0A7W7T4K6_9PSEU|nr:hypothetical protein [Saccharothrix violaceirubra]MBB4966411.1 hypothetical protein [Saccharothrix violaceirubra]
MTPLLIALRRGSAPVAVPVMALLGLFAGTREDTIVDWGWASGQLQQHGVLLVPLTAALAAWDVSRDRRSGSPALTRTYPRPSVRWVLLNCVGAFLAGLVGWAVTLGMVATNVRGTGGPYWSVVLLGPFTFVAAVLCGAVAGRYLPRHLAAPLTAVAVWLGLAFGSTSADPVLARLSGVDRECCDVASQPVAATVAGQWLWLAALAVAALAVLLTPRQAGVAGVAALAMAAVAVVTIRGTDARLTEPRTATAESCGTRAEVTVCLWPEHAADVDAWLAAATRYRSLFADLGDQPRLYLEYGLRPAQDVPRLGPVRPGMSEDDLVTALARRLFPTPPACAEIEGGSKPYPAADADALLSGWLARRIRPGAPADRFVPPDQVALLDRLTGSRPEDQRRWYADLVRAHRDCTTPAPESP